MRWWRRLRREPVAARNVVFLVLIVVVVAISVGAIAVFSLFLDRFGG